MDWELYKVYWCIKWCWHTQRAW